MYIHYTRSVSYYCNGFAQHRFVSSPERVVVTGSPYIHDMKHRELPSKTQIHVYFRSEFEWVSSCWPVSCAVVRKMSKRFWEQEQALKMPQTTYIYEYNINISRRLLEYTIFCF